MKNTRMVQLFHSHLFLSYNFCEIAHKNQRIYTIFCHFATYSEYFAQQYTRCAHSARSSSQNVYNFKRGNVCKTQLLARFIGKSNRTVVGDST